MRPVSDIAISILRTLLRQKMYIAVKCPPSEAPYLRSLEINALREVDWQ